MLFTLLAFLSSLSWTTVGGALAFCAYAAHHTRRDEVEYEGGAAPLVRPALRCAHTVHHLLHIASASSSMLVLAAEHGLGATYHHGGRKKRTRRHARVQLGRPRIDASALVDSDSEA